MYVSIYDLYVCMYVVNMYVCVYVFTYVNIDLRHRTRANQKTCHMSSYVHAYMMYIYDCYIYKSLQSYNHIHTYIHTYIHIHTHMCMQTNMQASNWQKHIHYSYKHKLILACLHACIYIHIYVYSTLTHT